MIEWNTGQQEVMKALKSFYKQKSKQLITLGGYAGTGKTTLISVVVKDLKAINSNLKIAFCAFTGKAALVLKEKLQASKVFDPCRDYCGTIHGLIYELDYIDFNDDPVFISTDMLAYDLIIIDEASMVDQDIFNDLCEYGKPIIAVGDHGQLPPINDKFNLMGDPELRLEEIMRQAKDSPIIQVSEMARRYGYIPKRKYSDNVRVVTGGLKALDEINAFDLDIIICGLNKTRKTVNNWFRTGRNPKMPEVGEPVICLKNNRKRMIFNGLIGTLKKISPMQRNYKVDISFPGRDEMLQTNISSNQFNEIATIKKHQKGVDLFDWAYCITCHKSQGSEFGAVAVIEEKVGYMTNDLWSRWLYTAVTRAKEKLILIRK